MMKSYRIFILVLALLMLPVPSLAKQDDSAVNLSILGSHELLLDPVSWESFSLQCDEGETLSGSFVVTQDGSLYIGDDTRYEYWLLEGIDFLIFDAASYELWAAGGKADPLFVRKNVSELNWSINIPSTGEWYIVYLNDTIFMKSLEGNFFRASDIATPIVAANLTLGSIGLILLIGVIVRSIRS
ncbi:MAG: hypothetical protein ACXACD_13200 [Candidatus Thorarchaeota archaeon]|jgi:hypothetical protein